MAQHAPRASVATPMAATFLESFHHLLHVTIIRPAHSARKSFHSQACRQAVPLSLRLRSWERTVTRIRPRDAPQDLQKSEPRLTAQITQAIKTFNAARDECVFAKKRKWSTKLGNFSHTLFCQNGMHSDIVGFHRNSFRQHKPLPANTHQSHPREIGQ